MLVVETVDCCFSKELPGWYHETSEEILSSIFESVPIETDESGSAADEFLELSYSIACD